jgi:hypothetical protein
MDLTTKLKTHLQQKDTKSSLELLNSARNADEILRSASDLLPVIVEHLNEDVLKDDPKLYDGCEKLLLVLAKKGNREEILFEFLELLETAKNDDIFTSILKCLQVIVLRTTENRVRSLEWTLNSIVNYITEIDTKECIAKYSGEAEEKLLEEDQLMQRILQLYLTILLFLQPIHDDLCNQSSSDLFRNTRITRKNVLACFILQLMEQPLVLFNLSTEPEKPKSYGRQCAEGMIQYLNSLFKDPYFFLEYVEQRMRWPVKIRNGKKGVFEEASQNIFLIEEKVPILSLANYYYLLIGENLIQSTVPRLYTTKFIFEKCLYLVVELLKRSENSVQYKAIKLGNALIEKLNSYDLSPTDLELKIHIELCEYLPKTIIYSASEQNRKDGISMLHTYVHKFDHAGRYFLITNLLTSIKHNGLKAYIITLYKNMIADELNRSVLFLQLI